MKLIDRSQFPPGGWIFRQPETGWQVPNPMNHSFDETVRIIADHRLQNPRFNLSTSFDQVASDLESQTCARLGNNPHWCVSTSADAGFAALTDAQKKTAQGGPAGFAGVVARIRTVSHGIPTLKEWFGDGMAPVSAELAQRRANTCMDCPKRTAETDWISKITGFIADRLRRFAEVKNRLQLRLPEDDKIGECEVCGCRLNLKVWTPLEHIKNTTDTETMDKFHEQCWIRNERE